MAEFWDIYNADRIRTGKLHERGKTLLEGEYHLVVHIWVQNDKGEFLITRRAMDKEPFPGLWECTGGSALAGENSEEAAIREAMEETGIDHSHSERRCVLSYRRHDWFGDVWLFRSDFSIENVTLQEGETIDVRFADAETIRSLCQSKEFCPYDYIQEFLSLLEPFHAE